jgi:hypothetical protein
MKFLRSEAANFGTVYTVAHVEKPPQEAQAPSQEEDQDRVRKSFEFLVSGDENLVYSAQQAPGPRESPHVEGLAPQAGGALVV